MSILVTGASGTVGTQIVQRLAASGAAVHALVRTAGRTPMPAGVTEVVGDMTDVPSMRAALSSVRTLFLLNAVAADEVTQALLTLNLARDGGVSRIVYQSVIHADTWTNVPHFAGKHAVERMILHEAMPATILRPAYFMQNDVRMRGVIEGYGLYPMPIGAAGVHMVDVRDIADITVAELLARHAAPDALPGRTLDVVGPEAITAADAAATWSEALGRTIQVGAGDLQAFEQQMAAHGPSWMAYDLRVMMARAQQEGMHPRAGAIEALEALLGRPLRRYQALVRETLGQST